MGNSFSAKLFSNGIGWYSATIRLGVGCQQNLFLTVLAVMGKLFFVPSKSRTIQAVFKGLQHELCYGAEFFVCKHVHVER